MRQHSCDGIARVTFDQAAQIAAIDAKKLVTPEKGADGIFVRANTMAYFILLNTWYMLLAELSKSTAERVILTAFRVGVVPLIEAASEMSDNIISALGGKPLEPSKSVLHDLFVPLYEGLDYDTSDLHAVEVKLISVLRYPKRFTPKGATALKDKTVSEFIAFNNNVKLNARHPLIGPDISAMQTVMREELLPHANFIVPRVMSGDDAWVVALFDHDGNIYEAEIEQMPTEEEIARLKDTYEDYCIIGFLSENYHGSIPTGSSASDVGREAATKIVSIYRTVGGFHTNQVPIYESRMFLRKMEDYRDYLRKGGHKVTSVAVSVPKNYKKNRMIAKEDPYASWCMKAFVDVLYDIFKTFSPYCDCIDLEDQSRAQKLCLASSMTDNLDDVCTIDLTSASDSISLNLLLTILPNEVSKWVSALRSERFCLFDDCVKGKNKTYTTHMACTSGQRQTFLLESLLFLDVAIVGHDRANCLMALPKRCRKTLGKKKHIMLRHTDRINVYGDDIEVPRFAFDSVITLLERLDLIPNREKSFDQNYLESCGVEAYWGIDMTTRYFPRKPLTTNLAGDRLTAQSVDAVIDLQHRLFGTDAATFLYELVLHHIPTMTSSLPGNTEYGDLWSFTPTLLGVDGELYPESVASDPDFCRKMISTKDNATGLYKVGLVSVGSPTRYTPWAAYKNTSMSQFGVYHVCETYAYIDFLLNGPTVGDEPIDELLGITESHSIMRDLFGTVQKFERQRF
jgi:hypothetical protein